MGTTVKKQPRKSIKKATSKRNTKLQPPIQAPELWEKQPKETTKAYRAYCIYQNMGLKRSLKRTTEKFYTKNTANLRQISTWSSKFNWVERVGAWEVEQETKKHDAHEAALIKMTKRHVRAATQLQRKALQRLKQIEIEELNAKDTLNYIIEAAKLERLTLGAPDQMVEHSGSVDISKIEIATVERDDVNDKDKSPD